MYRPTRLLLKVKKPGKRKGKTGKKPVVDEAQRVSEVARPATPGKGEHEAARMVREHRLGADVRVEDLEREYVTKSADRGEAPAPMIPAHKFKNKRRESRMKEFMAQQPRVEGGEMQRWLGYGFANYDAHPLHDLTHEEIQEYVAGTEYAELPEVKGANEDWPRLPHNTEEIQMQTTGMEETAPAFEEKFDTHADVFGAPADHPTWLSEPEKDSPYDVDLTKGEEYEREYSYAHIRGSPKFESLSQMRYVDGKWVGVRDTRMKPMPHRGFLTDIKTAVGTEVVDPDLDLGPTGDGGYQHELARFAALTNAHAGADAGPLDPLSIPAAASAEQPVPDHLRTLTHVLHDHSNPEDDMPEGTTTLIPAGSGPPSDAQPAAASLLDVEGDPLGLVAAPEQAAAEQPAAAPETHDDYPYMYHPTEGRVHAAKKDVAPADSWEDTDFLMEVDGETPGPARAASAEGLVNGVPVNALDTERRLVEPQMVSDEHEHHVFSGLYARPLSVPMSDFEKERLARCLEQHQKMGVPLAYKGVDPYSSSAFLRRKNPYNHKADDNTGRKHDLSVEFRLRQKLKLGYDVDKKQKPIYRLPPATERFAYKYFGSFDNVNSPGRQQHIKANVNTMSIPKMFPEGFVADGKWKMYGDTPYTAQMNEMFVRAYGLFKSGGKMHFTKATSYTTKDEVVLHREADLLRIQTEKTKLWEEKRAKKEKAYKIRMGLLPEDEEELRREDDARRETDRKLELLRSVKPNEDDVELARMELNDEWRKTHAEELPHLKKQEDQRSVYGKTPFGKSDTRYTGWKALGTHWRDLPPEPLQLRGTGFYDGFQMGYKRSEPDFSKMRRSQLDNLKWQYGPAYGSYFWKHFNSPLSSDHFIIKENLLPEDEIPKSGPARETTNDLMKHRTELPDWAFKPRIESEAEDPPAEVFHWGSRSSDEAAVQAKPAVLTSASAA